MSKKKAVVLGATGMVGQRFVDLLSDHPDFEVAALCASERSAGKKFSEASRWVIENDMPDWAADEKVLLCNPAVGDVDVCFSCLPGDLAGKTEEEFAKKWAVVSKASAHRMEKDVPLIIPEVNPEHLGLIERQRKNRNWEGFISTDPNCSTTQMAISLKPLADSFGLKTVQVVTMQALSGAGHPGVPSLDIVDNVIPFIGGEEDKMETEARKILGSFGKGGIAEYPVEVSAQCNRVNVSEGHLECLFVTLGKNADEQQVMDAMENFSGEPQKLKLHSAPKRVIRVRKEENRPQPRLDRDEENGMTVVVGRVRKDSAGRIKFLCLGHNTLRGAAGNGVLHAELLKARKLI